MTLLFSMNLGFAWGEQEVTTESRTRARGLWSNRYTREIPS